MKYSIITVVALAAISATTFTGCVESSGGNTFSRNEAIRAQEVYTGTVTDVREGKIEGEQSGAGGIGGAAMGGVVGNLFGGGRGNTIATVGGAVASAVAGNAIEKNVTSSKAFQITIQLDSGKMISIVQEKDVVVTVGQRVRVLYNPSGKSRVQPL